MERIAIRRIEVHSHPGYESHRSGAEGYIIPGAGSTAEVTFQINEPDGRYVQITELVRLPARDFNEVVDKAFLGLKRRLEEFGVTAQAIGQSSMEAEEDPPAE